MYSGSESNSATFSGRFYIFRCASLFLPTNWKDNGLSRKLILKEREAKPKAPL